MVEIWQANAGGRYAHPADDRAEIPLEDGFTGFGRSSTEDGGRFEFVTVKPGRVPWVDGRLQAPHLIVGVFARGLLKRVVDPHVLPRRGGCQRRGSRAARVVPDERSTLVARADDRGLRFDIVLQGDGQTTFFVV